MSPAPRDPWWMPLAVAATVALVHVLGRTWRIRFLPGFAERDASLRAGPGCIYGFWHARMLPLVWSHRRRGVAVLVSRHHDGEWIARVIHHLGFETARGSSTRGGDAAMRGLFAHASTGRHLAVTPDGPRGPAERLKPGIVFLASRTGLPIVPVATASHPCRRLRSWDGFRIPGPFARVVVGYGEPLLVPSGLDEKGIEEWRDRVERAIADLTATADREVAGASRVSTPSPEAP